MHLHTRSWQPNQKAHPFSAGTVCPSDGAASRQLAVDHHLQHCTILYFQFMTATTPLVMLLAFRLKLCMSGAAGVL